MTGNSAALALLRVAGAVFWAGDGPADGLVAARTFGFGEVGSSIGHVYAGLVAVSCFGWIWGLEKMHWASIP